MKMMRALILRMMNAMLASYDSAGPIKKRMISLFMHHFPGQITCEEFGDFMVDYLDGTMEQAQRRRFEFHLEACPMCRTHLAEYRAAVELARGSANEEAPAVPRSLINAILAARPRDQDLS